MSDSEEANFADATGRSRRGLILCKKYWLFPLDLISISDLRHTCKVLSSNDKMPLCQISCIGAGRLIPPGLATDKGGMVLFLSCAIFSDRQQSQKREKAWAPLAPTVSPTVASSLLFNPFFLLSIFSSLQMFFFARKLTLENERYIPLLCVLQHKKWSRLAIHFYNSPDLCKVYSASIMLDWKHDIEPSLFYGGRPWTLKINVLF